MLASNARRAACAAASSPRRRRSPYATRRARPPSSRNFPVLDPAPVPAFETRERLVAYVGAVTEARGAAEMVQAAARLPDGARLVLAGPAFPPALSDCLDALPGAERTERPGRLGRPAVTDLLARARAGLVVLHPTPQYVDAYPTKLFEYMAAGLPVVASDVPLWRRIVEGTGCGLLVDPLDPAAIAAACARLLADEALAAQMGAAGREAALARFAWRGEAERLVAVLRRRRGGPPAGAAAAGVVRAERGAAICLASRRLGRTRLPPAASRRSPPRPGRRRGTFGPPHAVSMFARLVRQSSVYALAGIVGKSSGLVLTAFYVNTAYLPVVDYGYFGVLRAAMMTALLVAGAGLPLGIIRFSTTSDLDEASRASVPSTALLLASVSGVLSAAAIWLAAPLLTGLLSAGAASDPLPVRLLALYVLFKTVADVSYTELRHREKVGWYVALSASESFLLLGFVLAFLVVGREG